MKILLILAAGLFLSVTAQDVVDHIEEVGCYDAFKKQENMINLRDKIEWETLTNDRSKLYKTINRCAEIAQENNWLFFAIEFYGECLHIKTLEEDLTKMTKSTKCRFGVGVDYVRMIYKGKCRSVFGCCPDNKTPATGPKHKGCPVDGEWSDYSNWGDCSVTCGDGTKSRKRTCTNPAPKNGGADCAGPDTDNEPCNERACTISWKGFEQSSIIGSNTQYLQLMLQWISSTPAKDAQWDICFSTKNSGFSSTDFHNACDNKQYTITIVQVGDYIFGGYSDVPWDASKTSYFTSSSCWLFSLKNSGNVAPFKILSTKNPAYAIFSTSSYGPTFGGGRDLRIADDANINADSYTNLGLSYEPPSGYTYGTTEIQSLLAGTFYFRVTNYEVFYKK